ncbi:MAG: cytochrome c peroxidase [Methylococcales bacterium]
MNSISISVYLNSLLKLIAAAICVSLHSLVIGLMTPETATAANLRIQTPAQARLQGLESLRKAVIKDGGVPLPENLDKYIKDKKAALQLGKTLFWDMQIGSDGVQACASCHFHAGADNRVTNQINPDRLSLVDDRYGDVAGYFYALIEPDNQFEVKSPNQTLTRADFPFVKNIQDLTRLADGTVRPGPNNSNDVSSSQGVFFTSFDGIQPGTAQDLGTALFDSVWHVDAQTSVRRVEPRNSPSVINAVFNYSNFWDGRANPYFNGQSSFGRQDPYAVIVVNLPEQGLSVESIALHKASLASQAVTPLLSPFEMSYGDFAQNNSRSLADIGKKLLSISIAGGKPLTPLGKQRIHPRDAILGELSKAPFRGLKAGYAELIKTAFHDHYWNAEALLPDLPYTQMEYNFGLFFGLSVALYESTLVADQTPFDQWLETGRFNRNFGKQELAGLNLFVNEGQCIKCHSGPELTSASVRAAQSQVIRAMQMTGGSALYDNGFYNIAVTPTTDDVGRGDMDPLAQPLAFSRQALFNRLGYAQLSFPILGDDFIPAKDEDLQAQVCVDSNNNGLCEATEDIVSEFRRVAVDGAFKTPGLRNTELTGPYFHNGGMATLKQVVQFYNRGGNFCSFNDKDLAPTIKPLGLTAEQEQQLVAFLMSLTDPRVRYEQYPFDHPELRVPAHGADTRGMLRINATGRAGSYKAINPFLNLDPQDAVYTPAGTCIRN